MSDSSDNRSSDSSASSSSASAPEYSPISEIGRESTSSSEREDGAPDEEFDIRDFDEIALAEEQHQSAAGNAESESIWNGFKIVGDNLD